jgi:hypothetical protein
MADLNASDLVYRSDVAAQTSGGAADANKMWLPEWEGMVMRAYDEHNMFEPMINTKTISSGTTYEFPITGTVGLTAAWAAGEELTGGSNSASTTFAIKLDKRPIAAHFEIDNIDLMITQWEFRQELARQAGLRLAYTRDRQIAAYFLRAAAEVTLASDPRSLPNSPIFADDAFINLGDVHNLAGATADQRTAAALKALRACEDFMTYLQENDLPTEGVYLAVTPKAFQDIRSLGIARDTADLLGGAGRPMFGGVAEAGGLGAPLSQGMHNMSDSMVYQGVTIIKSNHLPVVDYGADAANGETPVIGEARYNLKGSFNSTASGNTRGGFGVAGLIFQREAVVGLSLQGVKADTVEDVRRNTQFTVASCLKGTGVMRPELASVLCSANDNDSDVIGDGAWASQAGADYTILQEALDMTPEYVVTS